MRASPDIRRLALAALLTAWVLAACGGTVEAPSGVGTGADEASAALPRLAATVEAVSAAFDEERALALVTDVDRYFRVRGNEGYQRTLEHVEARLRESGFAAPALRRLELGPVRPTWTPRSAALELLGAGGEPVVRLQGFDDESERDRATLLVGSDTWPATDLEVVDATALTSPAEARGRVVLGRGDPWTLGRTYIVGGGAAGVLAYNLEPYHERLGDPDVAQFGYLPPHGPAAAFGFSLSPRTDARLREALAAGGPVFVRVQVTAAAGESAATALEATLPGTRPELGAIVLVAHVDEPGANDNGSGVAALAELACALREGIETGRLRAPARSLVFLWGQELEVSREWLAQAAPAPFAGIVLDMVGEDPGVVGAPFLIERMPDPGAVWTRPPDAHTEWGAGSVSADALVGHLLNDWVLAAVALVVEREPGWDARSNPFEGGSDHESFLARDIPALLGWHFTDEAYHTTADRVDRVSSAEMRRSATALGAAAFGLASGAPDDAAEVLEAVRVAAWTRAALVEDAARTSFEACSPEPVERAISAAWERWYDEALASVSSAAVDPLPAPLAARLTEVREAWGERGQRLEAQLAALAAEVPATCRAKTGP